MLSQVGVKYEREKIILNGDRRVLLDLHILSMHGRIELDGSQRGDQKGHGHGGSTRHPSVHGIKLVRLWNKAVLDGKAGEAYQADVGAG